MNALIATGYPGLILRKGKVRDVYDLGDRLVLIATDRISAFDWILPTPIPGKGKILTQLSLFWFQKLGQTDQILETDPLKMDQPFKDDAANLKGRSLMVKKTQVIPFECVVRGYLAGSGWQEYSQNGTVGFIPVRSGLKVASQLPEVLFTPATKADSGHDENISFTHMSSSLGDGLAAELRSRSIDLYEKAKVHALSKGLILADTKFEFGTISGKTILIDEALTPDSSRYWDATTWEPGAMPPSFDKQPVRDWLASSGWDRNSPPPPLPQAIVEQTSIRYQEALDRLAY
ncbi:MAG: phosphoribosylaminoimidazolesuccinocarboxamide synthase [Planctomycetota bacterium]